jgi:hypothetical protein
MDQETETAAEGQEQSAIQSTILEYRIAERRRKAELCLWALTTVGSAIFAFVGNRYWFYPNDPYHFLNFLWLSGAAIVLPLIFWLAFGQLPLQFLGTAAKSTVFRTSILGFSFETDITGRVRTSASSDPRELEPSKRSFFEEAILRKIISDESQPASDPRQLMLRFAKASEGLAERVYTRAGIFLLVGGLIAIGGVAFFYYRSINLPVENVLLDRVLSLLPGFGVLFFVEFVALFFLRQHRAAMDDFRYFDGVRRQREESMVILTMFAENQNVVATTDVLSSMRIYSGDQKLAPGETTEVLESRRLQRDDIIVIEKLFEAFGTMRAASDKKEKKSDDKKEK